MSVSVIIPNYNHAAFIEKRIESVLAQTYSNFEVILLDDCSTDNSRQIFEHYRNHPKVTHIIYNQENSGSTFRQWRKGIGLAKGRFIWIAESDDWCEPNLLSVLVPPLEADESIVVSYCQSVIVSPEGNLLYQTKAEKIEAIFNGNEYVRKQLFGVNRIVNASMCVFRKKASINIPADYETMRYCGDWLFWVYLCQQGRVHVSGRYLNYYVRHQHNVATGAVKEGLDFIEGNKIFHYIKNTHKPSYTEISEAIQIRLHMYRNVKEHLENATVENAVYKSVLDMDERVPAFLKTEEKRAGLQRKILWFKRTVKPLYKLFNRVV